MWLGNHFLIFLPDTVQVICFVNTLRKCSLGSVHCVSGLQLSMTYLCFKVPFSTVISLRVKAIMTKVG